MLYCWSALSLLRFLLHFLFCRWGIQFVSSKNKKGSLNHADYQSKNPILRGFNPDPNILRAKDRYYIIVSSFEWLPGIRVYESKNLVNWSHTTDILTTQVSLQGNPTNGSIWAPQISYADGLFYLVYTDVKSAGRPFKDVHNYLITASEITGPWSEPIYLNSNGFDPSLFHDLETGKNGLSMNYGIIVWTHRINPAVSYCKNMIQKRRSLMVPSIKYLQVQN